MCPPAHSQIVITVSEMQRPRYPFPVGLCNNVFMFLSPEHLPTDERILLKVVCGRQTIVSSEIKTSTMQCNFKKVVSNSVLRCY